MTPKPQSTHLGLGDAIGALLKLLADPDIEYSGPDVKDDIRDLRRAYPTDADYTNAILAFVKEITRALRHPDSYGDPMQRQLAGARRSEFPPRDSQDADLRVVIEALKTGGMRLVAMRHRHDPPGLYPLAIKRFEDQD